MPCRPAGGYDATAINTDAEGLADCVCGRLVVAQLCSGLEVVHSGCPAGRRRKTGLRGLEPHEAA